MSLVKMETILIQSTECLCCGTKDNITNHHLIPQRMNPKTNVIIPLCKHCHSQIHSDDTKGLIDMCYGNIKELHNIAKKLERYNELKNKETKE